MNGRTHRGRMLAAAAVAAAVAFTVIPAAAAVLPGTAEFSGAWADDGYITAADVALPETQRAVAWDHPMPGSVTGAEWRFTDATDTVIAGGNCGPGPLPISGTNGYLNDSCLSAALGAGVTEIRFQVRWTDGVDWSDWASDSLLIDLTAPTVVITKPSNGSINPVVVKSNGDRVIQIAGTSSDPGVAITVVENTLGVIATTTADATGLWSKDVELPTGTYTIQAVAADAAGNEGVSSPVTFDLDADLPFAELTSPPDPTVVLPDEPLIIEGIAADTNGQAFGGLLAVEVNIHDPLTVGIDPAGQRGNILGYANLGTVIHQENADCQPTTNCPASGVTEVAWQYDATWLPAGVYTLQILAHDRAGNEATQPVILRIVKL